MILNYLIEETTRIFCGLFTFCRHVRGIFCQDRLLDIISSIRKKKLSTISRSHWITISLFLSDLEKQYRRALSSQLASIRGVEKVRKGSLDATRSVTYNMRKVFGVPES